MHDIFESFIRDRNADPVLQKRLTTLSGEDAKVCARLIAELQPSANTLRSIIQVADEIAFRDDKSLVDIFSAEAVLAALSKKSISAKERQKLLREALDEVRYPVRTTIRTQLQQARAGIIDRCRVRIDFPEDLEGDALSIGTQFRSVDELLAWTERVQRAASDPGLQSIFSMLRGEEPVSDDE